MKLVHVVLATVLNNYIDGIRTARAGHVKANTSINSTLLGGGMGIFKPACSYCATAKVIYAMFWKFRISSESVPTLFKVRVALWFVGLVVVHGTVRGLQYFMEVTGIASELFGEKKIEKSEVYRK